MRYASSLIIVCSMALSAFGQNNNVQSAANSFKYKEYADAKRFIDLAAAHPKTSNAPKMWYYRGRIYLAIHDENNSALDADAISKSVTSLMTCLDVDDSKMYEDSSRIYLMNAAIKCFIAGVDKYKETDYAKSSQLNLLVLKALKYDKNKDLARNNVSEQSVYLNLYYDANAAEDAGKSMEYLKKLIDLNYNDANIYLFMSQLLLESKDTAAAISYVEKGRERFYDNKNLIFQQVDLSLKTGKGDALFKRMSDDIEYDPGNPTLYLVRGILNEKKGNGDGAKKDYAEALELNPNYFIAAYNLGAIYFNEGGEIINAAKDILDNNLYAKEKAKADALFMKAIPYFELALQIDPKDDDTAQRLIRLYARTGDDAKYQALKKKMEGG